MTTEDIIRAKVSEEIADNESGFSDVFNGFRAVSYTHLTLPTTPYV